ncbi:histidine kinase [Lysobacter ciconiae]|uniref:Histidine kinase n=1 Tax=Novilysobacter ciconiae TaxID=2781022 RepID=A0A7S6UHC0_9GAMM|nr:histidine kinase [Lysobacter ciconiae]QOW20320.1 histidine kinase [Lysobacter ciconiae]
MQTLEASTHPLDTLSQAPTIVWVMIAGECLAIILSLAPGLHGDRVVYFGLASLMIQWVSLITLSWIFLFQRRLRTVSPQRLAWVVLAFLLLDTWVVLALAWLLASGSWPMEPGGWMLLTARVTGIALAFGFLGVAAFQNHWRGRLHAVRAKQSELQALQARIRPHFLFNTLNTGAALVHERPEEAERLLLDLADLFRAALGGPRQILLADELSLARRYLEIEALRFGDRLTVHWHLPRELPAVTVPALSIQPLVENAVRHGVERLPQGDVDVRVTTTPDHVVVRISNPLPPRDGTASTGHQVGLNASQVRIEAMTDGRGSVQTQVEDGRFIATVRLPVGV